MKNIKELSTSGMTLSDREVLYDNVIPIPIGEIVYRSGGVFDPDEEVMVTKENQKEITMFWNALYFETLNDAKRKSWIAKSEYSAFPDYF